MYVSEETHRREGLDILVLPEQSFRHLHPPVLLLANCPYLARKEGLGESWNKREVDRETLVTMDEEISHGNLGGGQ